MNEKDIKTIFNQYKLDEHKFNYKDFISNLKEFTF